MSLILKVKILIFSLLYLIAFNNITFSKNNYNNCLSNKNTFKKEYLIKNQVSNISNILSNRGLNNFSSSSINYQLYNFNNSCYYNLNRNSVDCNYPEEDMSLILGTLGLTMAMGYYCFDTGDNGLGSVFTFLGTAGLFAPNICKWSKKQNELDRGKFIWHLIGIPTSFTVGFYHAASPDPDDILTGSLITAGLLFVDIIGATLLFK
ncbi:MAG: hypothetical protein GF353_02995 [Candidatus Lokiarchaeota archaeon]|nr:hypothetical protein [Candidatus Lokiarchaeota archaeon]